MLATFLNIYEFENLSLSFNDIFLIEVNITLSTLSSNPDCIASVAIRYFILFDRLLNN